MLHYSIFKSWKKILLGSVLLLGLTGSGLTGGELLGGGLFAQSPNSDTGIVERSTYSAKVYSEVDHLMRIARKNLRRYLKSLEREENKRLRALNKEYRQLERVKAANAFRRPLPPVPNQREDLLTGDDKEVAKAFTGGIPLPVRAQQRVPVEVEIEPEEEVDENHRVLYKEEVSLISINIYTEKNKDDINKYLSAKIEPTYFSNFPRFSFHRETEFFKYRYQELDDSFTFLYGPQDNAEITEVLESAGRRYYARVYFFRLADRSILDFNIYDSKTHELVWGKRQSMYVSFKESNITYRFLMGLTVEQWSSISFTNFLGIRLPVIGSYGIFFSFGVASVDPLGSQFYFLYSMSEALLLTVAVGPQLSYSLNELFGFSYHCCEFFLDFQFGYRNSIAINAMSSFLEREGAIIQNFSVAIGLSVSISKFMFYGNYDVLNNGFAGGIGFNF